MRKQLVLLAASAGLVLFQSCVLVRVPRPGHPMTRAEALSAGEGYCFSHGLRCELKEAHLTGNGIWKVKYRATRGDARGHVHLEIDAGSGAIVKVNEKIKDRGRDRDDDDDDDHGRGEHGASPVHVAPPPGHGGPPPGHGASPVHDGDDDDDHGKGKDKKEKKDKKDKDKD